MAAPTDPDGGSRGNELLWLVAGVFAALLAAWAALVVISHHHPVQEVPVVTRGGR